MRDPARIDKILKLLENYWKLNPDLRLGQIVSNMASLHRNWLVKDTFYTEDEVVEEGLIKMGEKNEAPKSDV